MKQWNYSVCIALCTTFTVFANHTSSPSKKILASKLDQLVSAYYNLGNFSGAVLVAKDGRILLQKAYGTANYTFDKANTTTTKFHIGSLSKQFTAMAILQLQHQGLLHIDDPIATYLPEYPNGDLITIAMLLNHRSGIIDHQSFADYNIISRITASLHDVINSFKDVPLQFVPGSQFQYSDSNYILLTAIIEHVSGISYACYLQRNIFDPLGMHDSGMERNQDILINKASGYALFLETDILCNANYLDMSFEQGAGALYSTIYDLYRWDRVLYTDEFIPHSVFRRIFSGDFAHEQYIAGWVLDRLFNKRRMWHVGNGGGFTGVMSRFIDDDVCIIVLSNFNFTFIDTIANKLAAIMFNQRYELPRQHTAIALEPELYPLYEGIYTNEHVNIHITCDNQHLFLEVAGRPGRYILFPESSTEFFMKESEATVSFTYDNQGNIDKIIIHQESQNVPVYKKV